jgi:hypothetical protein
MRRTATQKLKLINDSPRALNPILSRPPLAALALSDKDTTKVECLALLTIVYASLRLVSGLDVFQGPD